MYVCLSVFICLFACLLFVCLFPHERLYRLSVEEEDREEPMVSDADHHEDFQVIS